ncbi:MAG: hypothetical protein ABI134_32690, partial [Byssovorax sp.]
ADALAAGGQGSRDGGRTRGALLRRAATIAHRDLVDVNKAFGWLGDALITHVDDASLEALEQLGREVDDIQRVEATLSRALDEVFDGPLVRKLLHRRAKLRRDVVGDRKGAAVDLKKLHDLSPADLDVMNDLSSLLLELGDHRGMIQLYEDQILRGRDPALRAELARKVARIWEEDIGDAREAADAWRRVLRMKAGDTEATAGLERAKAGKLKRPAPPPAGGSAPEASASTAPPALVPSVAPAAPAPAPSAPPPSARPQDEDVESTTDAPPVNFAHPEPASQVAPPPPYEAAPPAPPPLYEAAPGYPAVVAPSAHVAGAGAEPAPPAYPAYPESSQPPAYAPPPAPPEYAQPAYPAQPQGGYPSYPQTPQPGYYPQPGYEAQQAQPSAYPQPEAYPPPPAYPQQGYEQAPQYAQPQSGYEQPGYGPQPGYAPPAYEAQPAPVPAPPPMPQGYYPPEGYPGYAQPQPQPPAVVAPPADPGDEIAEVDDAELIEEDTDKHKH